MKSKSIKRNEKIEENEIINRLKNLKNKKTIISKIKLEKLNYVF